MKLSRRSVPNAALRRVSFMLLAGWMALVVVVDSALASAPPPQPSAVLLPATEPGQTRLALDWPGEGGALLDVVLAQAGQADRTVLANQPLDAGVNLLSLPLDAKAQGRLRFDVRSADGTRLGSSIERVDGLRGGAGFAWESRFTGPGVDATVAAATVWDDGTGPALYIGGLFLSAGSQSVNHIARWDGSEWSALSGPAGTGVTGEVSGSGSGVNVSALTVYDGALIAGGSFTEAGGVVVNNIARWDGNAWSALDGGITESQSGLVVRALQVHDGALYVAGNFYAQAGGVTVNSVARWDGSAWSALGIGVDSGTAFALAEYAGDLVLGGNFLRVGGVDANRIARWNGSAWSALGTGLDGSGLLTSVNSLAEYDGTLVAGGFFTVAGGNAARNIARWDGAAWSALGAGTTGTVHALGVSGSTLTAGGDFTGAGGTTVRNIANWDGTTWSALTGPSATGVNTQVRALAHFDGDTIAGGVFATAGGVAVNRIASWDGSAWSALSTASDAGLNNQAFEAVIYDGDLIVGGTFTQAGATTVNSIARWDGDAWFALDGPSGVGVAGGFGVNALAVHDGALIVGGAFTTAGGVPASNIARWDGDNWSALNGTGGGSLNNRVWALASHDGALFAGGAFTQADGITVNRIARWNGSTWSALVDGGGIGVDNTVYALDAYDGTLIVAGNFINAGGLAANRIAGWNGTAWSALAGSAGTGVDDRVQALEIFDGALIVGGAFTQAGGMPANYIARWDGSEWSTLGNATALGGGCCAPFVRALAVYGDALYVGGVFEQADGATVDRIARWDGSAWSDLSGPAGTGIGGAASGSGSGTIEALVAFDADGAGPIPEKLAAAGNFSITGGVPNIGVGLYGPLAFHVSPDPLDFGTVPVGSIAGPANLVLTNAGSADVTVGAVSDPAAPFARAGGSCGATVPFTIAAGASCTLAFTYAPTAVGSDSAAVTLTSDASTSPDTVTLRGNAAAAATIRIQPDHLDAVLHPGETTAQVLDIGNIGAAALDWSVAQSLETVLSQTSADTIQDANSFACEPPSFGQPPFPTSANSFYRVFHLSELGIDDAFEVSSVTFGIERLTVDIDLTVKLHLLDGALSVANLTEIGSTTQGFTAQTLQSVTVPVNGSVPAGAILVVELAAPSQLAGHGQFVPASNSLGQSAPGYINSFGQCGINDITDLASVPSGNPDMHLLLSVTGSPVGCTLPGWVAVDPASGSVAPGESGSSTVTFDATGLATGDYSADLCVSSNDPVDPLVRVPLGLSVVDTFVVTPLAGPHGAISPDTPQTVDAGSSATFTLGADAGYHVDAVGGTCGGELVGNAFTTDPVTADCTVEANFAIDAPSAIAVVSGTPQTTAVNSVFADPLVVRVTNAAGIGVPNVAVTFDAPGEGAGAVLPAMALTDADGVASVTVAANTTIGTYTVGVGVDGIEASADFTLANTAGPLRHLVLIGGSGQVASINTPFAHPLTLQATDAWNNPVAGVAIAFAAPASGPGAQLSAPGATSNAQGIASVTAIANAEAGSYVVAASAAGAADNVDFALENTAPVVELSITIDDGRDYARYGQTLDYIVTVRNAGGDVARGVDVAMVLAPQLEADSARWICLDAASGACTAGGSGALADSEVTVPAQGQVSYLLSARVRADAAGAELASEATTNSGDDPVGASAGDTDRLVLFRNGFEAAESLQGDLAAMQPFAPFAFGAAPLRVVLPAAPATRLIDTVSIARAVDGSGFRVERLNGADARLRLVAVDRDGRERISDWRSVAAGADIMLGLDQAGDGAHRVRLDGTAWVLTLALDAAPGVVTYELQVVAAD